MVRCVSSRLLSFTRESSPLCFRRERPDFHRAEGCSRAASGPFERGVKGREFEDHKSRELLFRVGVRAVLYAAFSFLDAHGRSCLGDFQCIASDVNAGLDQSLVISAPSSKMRMGVIVLPHLKLFGRMVDHQSELHLLSPLA